MAWAAWFLLGFFKYTASRLSLAEAVLREGKKEALSGFTDRELQLLTKLLLRVVENLDPEAAAEIAFPHRSVTRQEL